MTDKMSVKIVPWKLHIRNDDKIKYLIKTSEVIVINRVMLKHLQHLRENEVKKQT